MAAEDGQSTKMYIMLILVFLICYVVLSSMLEHKKFPIHRSTVAIVVGIIAGFILRLTAPTTYSIIAKFDQTVISEVLFPPMLFAAGYTLHKSVFFKNIKYIFLFGFVGTFLSFIVSWGLIYQANQLDLVRDAKNLGNFRTLSDWQILLLAASLCSIDPGASEEAVSEYKYPRLYSILFGEDILKDAVTIVLFQAVMGLEEPQSPTKLIVYWYTFFQMLLSFIILILGSVAAATVSAFIVIFLSKKMRFLTQDRGVSQTGFLFLVGFFTYIYTEMLGFSGSLSVLLYGVFLNHYNIYNMSEQSRHASVTTFTFLSNIAEGLLFFIMGIMVWQGDWQTPKSSNQTMTHSYIFFFVVLLILCVGRFFDVYVLGGIGRLLSKKKFTLSWEEMHVLYLGGLVRGAVPFILFSSIKFSNRYLKNQGLVLKTTIIFIISFTSIFLNSFIPLFYKKRLPKLKSEYKRIFGSEKAKKEERQKKKSKLKQFEQKYIKKWLILDYEERKESIKEQKRRRKEKVLALAQQGEEEDVDMLTEEGNERLID